MDSIIGRILAVAYFALLALWALAVYIIPAKAHGPAEWIQRGAYKNSVGELCCGERDCFELSEDDVSTVEGGYFVKPTKELIPYNEAQPSPGGYWRCQWGGQRKCFFAPIPGT